MTFSIRDLIVVSALLAPAWPATVMAADEVGKDTSLATHPYLLTTCIVCDQPLKDGETAVVVLDAREMKCCSDKCAAVVQQKREYYKGVFDETERAKSRNIGPKGGDVRKNAAP